MKTENVGGWQLQAAVEKLASPKEVFAGLFHRLLTLGDAGLLLPSQSSKTDVDGTQRVLCVRAMAVIYRVHGRAIGEVGSPPSAVNSDWRRSLIWAPRISLYCFHVPVFLRDSAGCLAQHASFHLDLALLQLQQQTC